MFNITNTVAKNDLGLAMMSLRQKRTITVGYCIKCQLELQKCGSKELVLQLFYPTNLNSVNLSGQKVFIEQCTKCRSEILLWLRPVLRQLYSQTNLDTGNHFETKISTGDQHMVSQSINLDKIKRHIIL